MADDDFRRERTLPDAAKRALQEARERKRAIRKKDVRSENGGPEGLEPTRYGDWERKGRAVDF